MNHDQILETLATFIIIASVLFMILIFCLMLTR